MFAFTALLYLLFSGLLIISLTGFIFFIIIVVRDILYNVRENRKIHASSDNLSDGPSKGTPNEEI